MTDAPLIGPLPPPELHVMTFNIRRPVPHLSRSHPDRWSNRQEHVRRMLAAERPAILGLQEAMPGQLAVVSEALGGRRALGYGRDADLGGERVALFVDEDRLDVLAWDQLALSATPTVPGSRSWGAPYARTAVIARLRDRTSRAEFTVVNTHLDVVSARARVQGARMIAELVAGVPAIVLGDANAAIGSAPFRALAPLEDAWSIAGEVLTEEWGTRPSYRSPRAGRRIDWLLVSPGIRVLRAGINAAAAAASDHLPVQAALRVAA
ncbi:endonuclease/exonuclease/phosphatase family protein [Microbacteriaceae bacterium VKM Ac-2855]|nr:endonuclease/exonuclease/phosphatase family protein [Microbacteriaceae bacterium VKM Ac-2855]